MSFKRFILIAFGLIVIGGGFGSGGGGSKSSSAATSTPAEPVAPSCKTDWTKCADNSDMANNFNGWTRAKVDCKYEANDRAKYGDPEWPWLMFSSFFPGNDYSSGTVTLIEPDAKFQNGFGAKVRSRVVCKYDLRAKKVIDVSISAR